MQPTPAMLMRENRDMAGKILTHAKPPVDEDVVYVHVAAEGWQNGQLRRKEFVRAYYPMEIGGKHRTAIACPEWQRRCLERRVH